MGIKFLNQKNGSFGTSLTLNEDYGSLVNCLKCYVEHGTESDVPRKLESECGSSTYGSGGLAPQNLDKTRPPCVVLVPGRIYFGRSFASFATYVAI